MTLAEAIFLLYPELVAGVDWYYQDDSDGKGPYLAKWPDGYTLPTAEQIATLEAAKVLAQAQAQFKTLNDHANAQKLGLANRISTLQDSVDLDLATPDEVADLTTKTATLLVWKKYSILLGRIPTAIGWPAAPTWPPQPVDAISDTMLAITFANRSTVTNLANPQNVLLE